MRASLLISGFIAVLVGFGGSVAIVLSAASHIGASPAETTSWITALCLAIMASSAILSWRYRMPIVTAWSTPGAAVLAASQAVSMSQAVGAFFIAACLIVVTAAWRPLSRLVAAIPTSIASAMLAGVLFQFVMAIFPALRDNPALVLPMVLAFIGLRYVSAMGAVLLVLVLGLVLAFALGQVKPFPPLAFAGLVWIVPDFELSSILGLALPLYLVTMASQNLPGFAVLQTSGFQPPARPILAVTGLLSVVTAGFGAHMTNLAAITAVICTGPDAHPDQGERWRAGLVYAAGYAVLALSGAAIIALLASFPTALIVTIAGLAFSGPLLAALSASMAEERERFAALATFLVTASDITAFGIGAAFWGLVSGLAIWGLDKLVARRT